MVRVLLVSGSFPPMQCGVGDYSSKLATALSAVPGIKVAVLTGTDAAVHVAGDKVTVLASVASWRLTAFPKILRAIRLWRPDLVHIQYPTQGYGSFRLPWLLPALLRFAGYRLVQTWHEYMPMANWRVSLPLVLFGQAVIVVREDYPTRLARWVRWLLQETPLVHIPNATSIPAVRLSASCRQEVRKRWISPGSVGRKLVVYFGFPYEHKGVDALFDIANPERDFLVLICELSADDPYHQVVLRRTTEAPWIGNVVVTGFLPIDDVAALLSTADAVVLPFEKGGGQWNSSLHAATEQGTFVVTTSTQKSGYDENQNIYFAPCGNIEVMRQALATYMGRRRSVQSEDSKTTWTDIAERHAELYRSVLEDKSGQE